MPRPFRLLECKCSDGSEHLLTWSKDRGFFEPITNTSVSDVGLTVLDWKYADEVAA